MMLMKRRDFLKAGAQPGRWPLVMAVAGGGAASGHVVVVGGGYGGATVAGHLRMWSEGGVQVTLIERNPPSSPARFPTWSSAAPRRWKTSPSVTTACAANGASASSRTTWSPSMAKKTVTLKNGGAGATTAWCCRRVSRFHVGRNPWSRRCRCPEQDPASPGRPARRPSPCQQLESMKDGGVHAISIPKASLPLPARTVRARLPVANYFKSKPKSKVVIFDANEDVMSKKGLFTKAWSDLYKGNHRVPQQQRGQGRRGGDQHRQSRIRQVQADVSTSSRRTAPVTSRTSRASSWSTTAGGHQLAEHGIDQHAGHPCAGDAIFRRRPCPSPATWPTSTASWLPRPSSTCCRQAPEPGAGGDEHRYSFVDGKNVIHAASKVTSNDAATKTVQLVKAPAASAARNELEGKAAPRLGEEHLGRHADLIAATSYHRGRLRRPFVWLRAAIRGMSMTNKMVIVIIVD